MKVSLNQTVETAFVVRTKAEALKIVSGDASLLGEVQRDDGAHQRWQLREGVVVTLPDEAGRKLVSDGYASTVK